MSEQNYCYQCCLFDICKHIDRGTHTLASPACDAFDPGMRWIPVTERLPEPRKKVLCLCRANIYDVLKYIPENHGWENSYPNVCYMKSFVTHWMPLLEPPADEKEE